MRYQVRACIGQAQRTKGNIMGWREKVLKMAQQSSDKTIRATAAEQLENIRKFKAWQEKREQERRSA